MKHCDDVCRKVCERNACKRECRETKHTPIIAVDPLICPNCSSVFCKNCYQPKIDGQDAFVKNLLDYDQKLPPEEILEMCKTEEQKEEILPIISRKFRDVNDEYKFWQKTIVVNLITTLRNFRGGI